MSSATRWVPYAQQVSDTVGPYAKSARQRSAQVAHDAVEKFGPVFEDALDRVPPAVEAAKIKMHDDVFPKLAEALAAAAAAPLVVEATDRGKAVAAEAAGRGKAVVAAAKGEVVAGSQAEESLAEAVGHRDRRRWDRGHRRPQAARQLGCGLAGGQAHGTVRAEGHRTVRPGHLAREHLVGRHGSHLGGQRQRRDRRRDRRRRGGDRGRRGRDRHRGRRTDRRRTRSTEPEAELGSESGEDVDPESEDGEAGDLPAEDAEAEGGEVSASGDTEGTSDDTK